MVSEVAFYILKDGGEQATVIQLRFHMRQEGMACFRAGGDPHDNGLVQLIGLVVFRDAFADRPDEYGAVGNVLIKCSIDRKCVGFLMGQCIAVAADPVVVVLPSQVPAVKAGVVAFLATLCIFFRFVFVSDGINIRHIPDGIDRFKGLFVQLHPQAVGMVQLADAVSLPGIIAVHAVREAEVVSGAVRQVKERHNGVIHNGCGL